MKVNTIVAMLMWAMKAMELTQPVTPAMIHSAADSAAPAALSRRHVTLASPALAELAAQVLVLHPAVEPQ